MSELTKEQITKRIEKAKASRERHVGMLGKYPDMQHISEAFIRCANEEIALCNMALAWLAVQPRPIEDAPKDGTNVIWFGSLGRKEMGCWEGRPVSCVFDEDLGNLSCDWATHFIPLSSLPEVK